MRLNYSVLMSVYHKEKSEYLKESIDSIIMQTLKPNQIVLVKDGPLTKELDALINDYINESKELFTIVELEKNVGLGLALNEGLKYCRNDLIARMDSDDISHPNRMEIQLKKHEESKCLDIVGTLTAEFSGNIANVVSSRVVPKSHDEIVDFSKRRSPFNHATVMYKKSAVEAVGGYGDILRNEDYDLFVRMLNKGSKAENLQQELYYVRLDKDYHKRRKSWVNCKNYIGVVYNFWKSGYSSFSDLVFVFITQIGMFLAPVSMLEFLSDKFLRSTK